MADYLDRTPPGTTGGYAVLPRRLVEAMPLPWQQQMSALLTEFHQAFGHLNWPEYRVVPSRYERLVNLDDEQLAEVGCTVEVGDDGELEYRMRDGRMIDDPANHRVLVSCLDPLPESPTPEPPPPPVW